MILRNLTYNWENLFVLPYIIEKRLKAQQWKSIRPKTPQDPLLIGNIEFASQSKSQDLNQAIAFFICMALLLGIFTLSWSANSG